MFPLSQGSEDSEDDEAVEVVVAADTQGKLEASSAFNSDDDAESCPICLNAFRDQAVGTPENCAHYFCLDCIVEWSKVRQLLFRALPPKGWMNPVCLRDPASCAWPPAGATGLRGCVVLAYSCAAGSWVVGDVHCRRQEGRLLMGQ